MITIVDYGMGNLGAIVNMLEFLGYDAVMTADPLEISKASKLILPGVGAFDRAMLNLRRLGFVEPLEHAAFERKVPTLGLCLGMHLLGRGSAEGNGEPGLGWVAADTLRIDWAAEHGLKVPHVGWNSVSPVAGTPLFAESAEKPRFYFVHSYYMQCDDRGPVAATCTYGREFCCAVSQANIHGVQFHPEKSHKHGLALLKTFAEWN
ncbi:imidazole glycerol phosphate synthase subunit HisH [Pseudorhizobium pelagicum]|uniref:Imidazole glycerol phosphate synthase subunit HisH n=1 Tax=Pseudorhizobium pelagicum TaxID=1509405 RepID=A0A922NWT4_9HYPH|nr:imidazole glycerol phosphate synthase subunit HisH [Pseudorhizobium pelagicum]KEQ02448.1 imidazole glycerol phosphate synthase [Pseudorhizobium pelagicum]KEQ02461.1 imidazole glycerol phosphate synthase [Pseudorhizobium pelagicum]